MTNPWHHAPTVKSWDGMIQRCTNPNAPNYKYYGGKGVQVCDAWKTLEGFHASMGLRPDRTTLDRINVCGDYEPANCQWVSHVDQMRNQTRNVRITINGETRCLAEWCQIKGLKHSTVWNRRHRAGLSWEAALSLPNHRGAKINQLKEMK